MLEWLCVRSVDSQLQGTAQHISTVSDGQTTQSDRWLTVAEGCRCEPLAYLRWMLAGSASVANRGAALIPEGGAGQY